MTQYIFRLFSSPLVARVMLVLLLSFNAVTVSSMGLMSSMATSTEQISNTSAMEIPCHEDSSNTNSVLTCCETDCSTCVTSVITSPLLVPSPVSLLFANKFEILTSSLANSHARNLYRPPILI